jgi:hypothetical protein
MLPPRKTTANEPEPEPELEPEPEPVGIHRFREAVHQVITYNRAGHEPEPEPAQ